MTQQRIIYPAVVHKDPDSDYGISFPDIPSCISAAATINHLFDMAVEAVTLHINVMVESGEAIPVATKIDEHIGDPEYSDAICWICIPIDLSK